MKTPSITIHAECNYHWLRTQDSQTLRLRETSIINAFARIRTTHNYKRILVALITVVLMQTKGRTRIEIAAKTASNLKVTKGIDVTYCYTCLIKLHEDNPMCERVNFFRSIKRIRIFLNERSMYDESPNQQCKDMKGLHT